MRDHSTAATVIENARLIRDGAVVHGRLAIAAGRVVEPDVLPADAERLDARGALVLPGIVDVHGDAFERQIMPRKGVTVDLGIGLLDSDRQLTANGITTAFHGITVSWEPGLRGRDNAGALIRTLWHLRPRLGCDTRLHLRWETFALDAEADVARWLRLEPRPILAFNDHTTGMANRDARARGDDQKSAARAGIGIGDYRARLAAAWARRAEVPAAVARLAAAARAAGATLLGHDERSPEERAYYRGLGATAAEFPVTPETALAARAAGEHTILGAPNVLRGGSHCGAMDAAPAVQAGLCTVLATDYYYPAPLHAVFRLVRDGRCSLAEAWALVSAHPAEVVGLTDRGRLVPGQRADVVWVDDGDPALPRVLRTMVAGRSVHVGV
ncbi:MAG: alpha-D-ribose 1-methylphosphonate 5-triphosphate diphosphatase [Pseudomonadota bacterium]